MPSTAVPTSALGVLGLIGDKDLVNTASGDDDTNNAGLAAGVGVAGGLVLVGLVAMLLVKRRPPPTEGAVRSINSDVLPQRALHTHDELSTIAEEPSKAGLSSLNTGESTEAGELEAAPLSTPVEATPTSLMVSPASSGAELDVALAPPYTPEPKVPSTPAEKSAARYPSPGDEPPKASPVPRSAYTPPSHRPSPMERFRSSSLGEALSPIFSCVTGGALERAYDVEVGSNASTAEKFEPDQDWNPDDNSVSDLSGDAFSPPQNDDDEGLLETFAQRRANWKPLDIPNDDSPPRRIPRSNTPRAFLR